MNKTLIIAEAGVNHNGSLQIAKELITVAAESGSDVVKFQTFKAAKLVTKSAQKADYQKKLTSAEESQQEMLRKLELSDEDHVVLKNFAKESGIQFMSSPFDIESADFLVKLGVETIKVPSGEITNAPLLLHLARTRKKLIVSTGMCDLEDIERALQVLAFGYLNPSDVVPSTEKFRAAVLAPNAKEILIRNITLLHCTSDYPAKNKDVNLRAMNTIATHFGIPVGYSDHSLGISVSLAAVALGAVCIEKHFTLDKSMPGPDHKASLSPQELRDLVSGIRQIEESLGSPKKGPQEAELSTRLVARKSLVAKAKIKKGEKFSPDNVDCKRPGSGMSPSLFWGIIGSVATRDYEPDDLIQEQS